MWRWSGQMATIVDLVSSVRCKLFVNEPVFTFGSLHMRKLEQAHFAFTYPGYKKKVKDFIV